MDARRLTFVYIIDHSSEAQFERDGTRGFAAVGLQISLAKKTNLHSECYSGEAT